MERARPVQDREQLPRGVDGEHPLRRRGSVHREPRAVGHRSARELGEQADLVDGQQLDRQEPVRAEERAPRARGRQHLRAQLAAGAERLFDSLHGARSVRHCAVVDRVRRRLHAQRRAARRERRERVGRGRHLHEPAGTAAARAEQSVRRCERGELGWERAAGAGAERGGKPDVRPQYRVPERRVPGRVGTAAGRVHLHEQHRTEQPVRPWR